MIFRVYRVALPTGTHDLNALRGALGKALYGTPEYTRLFAPAAPPGAPSGYRTPPRPFALRSSAIHVFSSEQDARLIAAALNIPHAPVEAIELNLLSELQAAAIRVEFRTPITLKGSETPEFGALFSRARDRVATLSGLYGAGVPPLDFRLLKRLSTGVALTNSELRRCEILRRSAATRQVHSIGGSTGYAEYEGTLGPFMAILQAAELTGVGSKTAWGNGEISVEIQRSV